jgi:hypothetical protein
MQEYLRDIGAGLKAHPLHTILAVLVTQYEDFVLGQIVFAGARLRCGNPEMVIEAHGDADATSYNLLASSEQNRNDLWRV